MENYAIVSCVSVFITALVAVIISYSRENKKDKEYNELQKNYDVLDNNYNKLDEDYEDLEESMRIYTIEQSKKIEEWKGCFESARKSACELQIELLKEEAVADIFEEVIKWFIDSVDNNCTSKAITYHKCIIAIADAQKIDLQNQMPDGTPNKATECLFSPNEAPGKPL